MIDVNLLITTGISVVASVVTGWTTWFFTRKKYNSEVDSNEIENLKNSLQFYENIVKDNNEKLQFYIDLAKENRLEVYRLKGVVHRLLNNSCLDGDCLERKFYTDEQIRDIIGDVTVYKDNNKDETNTEKKIL